MMILSEDIKIVEKRQVPTGAYMIYGLPDAGLVGLIATSHLISELKLTDLAYVDSDLLPPIVILHEGLPLPPLRILGGDGVLATISETPIPADVVQKLTRALVEWSKIKGVKFMVSIGGVPIPDRQNIEEPKVFATASTTELLSMLEEKGVEIFREGYMVGPQALLLRYGAEQGVPSIGLMAQSFYNYPDPEAAAAVLREIDRILGVKVDVSKLLEKGEEIRLRARDIMKRTQSEMNKMKKTQEYDIPLYV
jgi:uncharacterized protein